MNHVLLSTAYFPPISWMAAALNSGRIELEIHETYPKQTFRNRCNIATSSGILSLTVPVKRINGSHTKTCDIRIDNSNNWQLLHWRSIITAYNKSPYFLFYRDLIEPVYFIKHERLIDLNYQIINILLAELNINYLDVFHTNQYDVKPDSYDLRNGFNPGSKRSQIIKYELPRYMQTFESKHDFLTDLSIIDLLFNLGPDAVSYLADVKFSYNQ